LYVRVTHWINAVAILIIIGSGLQIYKLFAFTFPEGLTLG
jgi:cytochrome b subunit of formate dehydrogenase